ncbi:MAG: aromatic ring-hydroxylating dioxygenase subunit alpha, partial [Myxococcota bacterium]
LRERCGDLSNYWYAAAQSQQVSAKKPFGCVVLGEMLVLWRTRAGTPVAMRDRCLHRNAPLSKGELFDDCIGCPYHGWTYSPAGDCVNVPSEGPDGRAQPGKRVRTFPCEERDGLVWVWLGEQSPEALPDRRPFAMPHHGEKGWGSYTMETRFPNSVTNLVENFMDVPHTVWVHRGWFRDRKRKRVGAKVERTATSVLVTYDQPNDSIGFSNRLLNPRGLPMTHTDHFYMPSTTRVDYVFGDEHTAFVITSTCTPVDDMETHVFTRISFKLGMWNRLARLLLPPYTRKVIQQDVDVMDMQGRALKHYGGRTEFNSTPADRLHVYIESLRNFAARGNRGEKPRSEVSNIEFWI